MQRLVEAGKNIVNLLQGSLSQEVNADTEARDTASGITDTETSPSSTRLAEEIINARNATGGRKRSHAEEGEQVERKRMRSGISDHERRLTGDFVVGKNASAISIPDPRDEADSRRLNVAKMHGKPGAGPFQFKNTLYDQPHAATRKWESRNSASQKTGQRQTPYSHRQELSVARSRGLNVRPSRELQGDAYGNELGQSPKRRRLNGNSLISMDPGQQVDLTNDDTPPDVHFGRVMGRGTGYAPSLSSPPPADGTIAAKVGRLTQTETDKKRRKPKDGSKTATPPHTRTFSSVVPVIEVNRTPQPTIPTYNEDGDEVQLISSHQKVYTPKYDGGLSNGFQNGNRQKRRRSHDGDSENLNEVMREDIQRRRDRSKPELQRHVQRPPRESRSVPQAAVGLPEEVTTSIPLRDMFVRNEPDPEPLPRRIRASQRMQATSKGQGGRESSSEDELAGASTVPSVASRSVSPQKRDQKYHKNDLSRRSHSPTNLPPSQFTGAGVNNRKILPRSKNQPTGQMDQQVRIPVNMIFCRSCCLEQPGIVLVWENDGFFVEVNGDVQRVPNKQQAVFIGSKEASRQWLDALNEGSLAVQVKGSSTANSNGEVIIEFEDSEGLSECYNALYGATSNTLTAVPCSREKMKNIINHQRPAILLDHKKHSKPNVQNDLDIMLIKQRQDKRLAQQPSNDEEIRYERDDNSGTRRTRRSLMRDGPHDQASNPTRSKYYTYIEPTSPTSASIPRTSTRTTRAPKPKSPTPPPPVRWTRENKLERWSHSVIYPQEGAVRRVTVDFKDLERLDEGEFLNDNIIGFALRRIEESMAPEHKETVLFFNSFFYTALTTKAGKKAFNYDAVKRWTKNKDVFSYQYIVVPINIDLHWFVMIICNLPNLSRKPPDLEEDAEKEDEMLLDGQPGEQGVVDGISSETVDGDLATQDAQNSMHHLSLLDDDIKVNVDKQKDVSGAHGSQEPLSSLPSPANNRKTKKKGPARQRTFDTETPTIMSLDSFGRVHPAEVRFLKDYLNAEGEDKRGMQVASSDLQGMTAKGIPEQDNFCDCGLYVVGYLEEFAKNPKRFVNKVLRKELDDKSDFANFDPSEKRAEIRNELLRLQKEQDAERNGTKVVTKPVGEINSEPSKVGGALATTRPRPVEATIHTQPTAAKHSIPTVDGPADVPDGDDSRQDEAKPSISTSSTYAAENDDLEESVPRPLLRPSGPTGSSSSRPFSTTAGDVNTGDGLRSTSNLKEAYSDALDSVAPSDFFSQMRDCTKANDYAPQDQPMLQSVDISDEGENLVREIQDSQESRQSRTRES